METSLPTPMTGRVYVNLLEGIFHYHIEYELLLWSTSKITLIIHDYPISASMMLISWKISTIPPSPWDVEDGCDPMRSKGHGRTWNKSPEIVYLGTESAQLWLTWKWKKTLLVNIIYIYIEDITQYITIADSKRKDLDELKSLNLFSGSNVQGQSYKRTNSKLS